MHLGSCILSLHLMPRDAHPQAGGSMVLSNHAFTIFKPRYIYMPTYRGMPLGQGARLPLRWRLRARCSIQTVERTFYIYLQCQY